MNVFLGSKDAEIRTSPTATSNIYASSSDDMNFKQRISPGKSSESVSSDVMGYLRNSGWMSSDSKTLHQKYVDNIHAAEIGDPSVILNSASRAYNDASKYASIDDNAANRNVEEENFLRSIRSTLGSAMESVVTMLPLSDKNNENFQSYTSAKMIENIFRTEQARHKASYEAAQVDSSSSSSSSIRFENSDHSFDIVGIENIDLFQDEYDDENNILDIDGKRPDGSVSSSSVDATTAIAARTSVVIPGFMDFDPKTAAASTMKKKKLTSPLSLNAFSTKNGLSTGAFFASKWP